METFHSDDIIKQANFNEMMRIIVGSFKEGLKISESLTIIVGEK